MGFHGVDPCGLAAGQDCSAMLATVRARHLGDALQESSVAPTVHDLVARPRPARVIGFADILGIPLRLTLHRLGVTLPSRLGARRSIRLLVDAIGWRWSAHSRPLAREERRYLVSFMVGHINSSVAVVATGRAHGGPCAPRVVNRRWRARP